MTSADAYQALTTAGYAVDLRSLRQQSDTTRTYRWNHKDGSYYVVTKIDGDRGHVKSWFYRGLGGNAKSGKWFKDWPDEHDASLTAHVKKNKKKTPKTVVRRRSSDEVRRANFVLYD